MAETIVDHVSGPIWHWYSIMHDLEEQGGLKGVVINPLTCAEDGCEGMLADSRFFIIWIHNQFMLLTMQQYSEELVRAFAKVLEYEPFCRYQEQYGEFDCVTVEWERVGPDFRFRILEKEGKRGLERITLATN